MRTHAALVGSAFVFIAAGHAAASESPPTLDPIDLREIMTVRAQNPHAAQLFDQAVGLAASGKASDAEALYRQAHTEFSSASILWRRDCELLTQLGRRDEAILACSSAVAAFRSGVNMRALVSALVDGPTQPTPTNLGLALSIVANERTKGPSLTVAASACDIAEKIGDEAMLQGCTEELERLAPEDPATRRAESILAARCPPWRFWTGWGSLAAAGVVTLAHAVARWLRGRRSARPQVAAVASLILVALACPRAALAQSGPGPGVKPSSNWLSDRKIDDEHPEASMPTEAERNADPLQFGYWLQDVALKGEHASKKGDHALAARFYEALNKAVPDRAIGYIKACEEYEAMGDHDRAVARCGEALLHDGLRVKDYSHFIELVLDKKGPLTKSESLSLANVLAHMREDPAGRPFVDDLECQVGARTENVAQLKECTASLVARAPNDAKTISYLWALAVAEGHTSEADALLERAKAAGVAPEDLRKMRDATEHASLVRGLRSSAFVVALGLLAAGLIMGARLLLARLRRSNASPPAPPPAQPTEPLPPAEANV